MSQNHQAEPNWILPGISSSWNAPRMVPSISKSAGFRLYRMTFGQASALVSALSRLLTVALQSVTAIMSKPVSGPSLRYILSLTLRRQL